MPCRHEGGKGRCKQYPSGGCKALIKKQTREYYRNNFRRVGLGQKQSSNRGAAGEHFVIHWLLARGLDVGGPYNQNGPHDLFVKVGVWRTVQVKVGAVNLNTGNIWMRRNPKRPILSDLIAVVDLEGQRIKWMSNTDEPVPKELL